MINFHWPSKKLMTKLTVQLVLDSKK